MTEELSYGRGRPMKSLNEMDADEIAALTVQDFERLAVSHNDDSERREQMYQRSIC